MTPSKKRLWLSELWPFAVLCLVSASRWIAADQWPRTGATLRSEAVACAFVAVVLSLFLFRRAKDPQRPPPAPKLLVCAMFAGVALLGMPSFGAALHGAPSEAFNRTAAFCFVPLIAALCAGFRTGTGTSGLGAPLAGVAGALLLLPLALPVDLAGWSGLLMPPVVVGLVCGLWTDRIPGGLSLAIAFTLGGAAGLAATEVLRSVTSSDVAASLSVSAICIDAVLVACTLLSLLRLGTERYATRYLAAPIITVVQGMLIFRPQSSFRVWTGLLLLAGAAVAFWRQRSVTPETSSLLLS